SGDADAPVSRVAPGRGVVRRSSAHRISRRSAWGTAVFRVGVQPVGRYGASARGGACDLTRVAVVRLARQRWVVAAFPSDRAPRCLSRTVATPHDGGQRATAGTARWPDGHRALHRRRRHSRLETRIEYLRDSPGGHGNASVSNDRHLALGVVPLSTRQYPPI